MGDPQSFDCLTESAMAAYLDGVGNDDQRRSSEAHLVRCAACRSAIADAARGALGDTDARATLAEVTLLPPSTANGEAWLPGPGDMIADKYLVEGYLGSGSMGWVVAARHRDLGQRVAIKVLRPTGAEAARRFVSEAKITARLSHPNIPRVFDVGRLPGGAPYMVMEYLVGMDLARRASSETITIDSAVRYVIEACAGLSAAHAAGVVHRDLKPSNLFLATVASGATTVKVLDFGISKVIDPGERETNQAATATGVVLGSPLYMSPEQIRARPDIDTRSDVWSLGVILYQLATGQPPFRGPGVPALSVSIAVDEPTPPSRLCPAVSPPLERIILRCLAKSPAARYPTAEDLARELSLLGHPSQTQRLPRAFRAVGRLAAVLALAGALMAAGRAWTRARKPTAALATATVLPQLVPPKLDGSPAAATGLPGVFRPTPPNGPRPTLDPALAGARARDLAPVTNGPTSARGPVVRRVKRKPMPIPETPGPLDTPD